jgi:hypothetical protein
MNSNEKNWMSLIMLLGLITMILLIYVAFVISEPSV